MFILKCIDLSLIVIICVYIGINKSKQFGKRVKELKNFKSALGIFKTKIEFTYEPIKDIFEEISNIIYENNENIFQSFCDNLHTNEISIVWKNAVLQNKNLEKEDKEIILMLGKMLGKTDKNGQISEIEMVNKFLDKQVEISEEVKNKNEKLYKTLGIVCGLTIAIIFV